MSLLDIFRRPQFLCVWYYQVVFRVRVGTHPLHVADGEGRKDHTEERVGGMIWHSPRLVLDDAPAEMRAQRPLANSIQVAEVTRRALRRDGHLSIVTHDGRPGVVPSDRGGMAVGWFAGIAVGQAAADDWVLRGRTDHLKQKQAVTA